MWEWWLWYLLVWPVIDITWIWWRIRVWGECLQVAGAYTHTHSHTHTRTHTHAHTYTHTLKGTCICSKYRNFKVAGASTLHVEHMLALLLITHLQLLWFQVAHLSPAGGGQQGCNQVVTRMLYHYWQSSPIACTCIIICAYYYFDEWDKN